MAFTAEVLGFEGGDTTGVASLPGSPGLVTAAAARTGTYGCRVAPAGGGNSYGVQFGKGLTFGSGAEHAGFAQFQYRMATAPSVNNSMLCGDASNFWITVNTNMTATLHMVGIGTSNIGMPALSASIWYRVQFRQWTADLSGDFGTSLKYFRVVIDYTDANGVVQFISSAGDTTTNIGYTAVAPFTLGSISSLAGGSPTWSVDFDDCIYVAASGAADVGSFPKWSPSSLNGYARSLFYYDKVFPVLITGQGPNDGFTPAGGYASVNEVPLGSGTVAGSGSGTWTDYLHQPAPGTNIEALTCRMNANVSSISVQAVTIDSAKTLFTFRGGSQGQDETSPFATLMYPTTLLGDMLTPAQFAAQVFGVECEDSHTITLRNIYLEVLSGEPLTVDTDVFAVTPEIFLEFVTDAIEEDVTFTGHAPGFSLANRGEEINVPETWRLERMDIGPRTEEKA